MPKVLESEESSSKSSQVVAEETRRAKEGLLVDVIASSIFFRRARQQVKILRALHSKPEGLSVKDVAIELGWDPDKAESCANVGSACWQLGDRLKSFFASKEGAEQELVCIYCSTKDVGAYKLIFESTKSRAIAASPEESSDLSAALVENTRLSSRDFAQTFWSAHVAANFTEQGISIFISVPTFFRLRSKKKVFRFFDVNANGSDERAAIRLLKDKDKDEKDNEFSDSYVATLTASDIYLLRGEVEARDTIEKWFAVESDFPRLNSRGVKVNKEICQGLTLESKLFAERSTVLLGSPRTSFLTRDVSRHHTKDLPFLSSPDGIIHIKRKGLPSPARRRLEAAGARGDIQAPTLALIDQVPDGSVYAVVTRIKHPIMEDAGAVTLVSCDSTRALKSVASMLTNPRELEKILGQTDWNQQWPERFQLLLSVELSNDRVVGGAPVLLCWGPYSIKSK